MAQEEKEKKIIGRVEIISFPELGIGSVYARIDTGAQTSAIWASSIEIVDNRLKVVLFDKNHPAYTGETVHFDTFSPIVVASSNGQTTQRYKVQALIKLKGKKIRAKFTLADRSTQVYPVLIGRNVLRGKFIVDVKLGNALRTAEKSRSTKLQSQLKGKVS